MKENVLMELNPSEPERPKIGIDGTPYSMAIPEDFEYCEFAWLVKTGRKITEYFRGDIHDKKQLADIEQQIDTVARRILPDVPDEVFAKLRPSHKMKLINVFSEAVGEIAGAPRPENT